MKDEPSFPGNVCAVEAACCGLWVVAELKELRVRERGENGQATGQTVLAKRTQDASDTAAQGRITTSQGEESRPQKP